MSNIIPFVPRIVKAEEEMPQVEKIDWSKFPPTFKFDQVEPGGFAEIEGLVPMEIALLMLNGLEAYKAERASAVKTKRSAGKKKKRNS
ncbi:hypothetical protein [Bradyrhizobium canariense]|uniref:Uncharacterized protein n=1 Tax=Bradyrhizobium canariense TaxID=255045 RepID=A0A1X3FTE3_9BRAD|nr:hypothetical protein [Bradyrhizobium canariense]OSI69925.1 hypothetical protein BSZ22_15880 [Bradyrhizobium canariense]OSI74931.1 hypothetical protein BSZ23_32065 [Bradyrhizobium canariense]OSI83427.1 hypothetical protein BSZ24_36575 [Bradyrhizobium canariense]OSI86574.1 hypothetical protein BSZ25_30640 [Bradyrhizobium canariense]OSI98467.1 hypothetical protein BSZ16_31795 [Bradyrhizobium canariense]